MIDYMETLSQLTRLLPWVHNQQFLVEPCDAENFRRYEQALKDAIDLVEDYNRHMYETDAPAVHREE